MSVLLLFDVVWGLVSLEILSIWTDRNFKRSTFFEVSLQVQYISGEMEKVQVPYESTCVWLQAQTSGFFLLFTKFIHWMFFGERML
jgi:hypothetical protein